MRNAYKIVKNLNFLFMLHSIKTMAVSAVAPVVKLFPAWALRHTKKGNFYASYFLLSHKREMKILSKTPNYRFRRMAEHLWRPETRLKCLADGRLYELFVDGIRNSKEFYAAFNNEAARNRAVACKSYTLSDNELVQACNSDENFVYLLLKKQAESFSYRVVEQLNSKAQQTLLHKLIVGYSVDILQRLDRTIRQQALYGSGDLQKMAAAAMSLLLKNKTYRPNLEVEQLVNLPDFNIWISQAEPMIIADKMVAYWQQNHQFERLMKLASRLAKCSHKDAINKAQSIAAQLPAQQSIALVSTFIKDGIACPMFFELLRINNLAGLVEQNLKLCRMHACVNQIPEPEIRELPETLKEQALIALAHEGALRQQLFEEATSELKQHLFDIVEENAQLKWFRPHAERKPEGNVVSILKSLHRISGRVQDMSLGSSAWAEIFAAEGFYDDEHVIKLLQSKHYQAVLYLVKKQGLTREQYTALLFGPLAGWAPQLEAYVK